MAGYGRIFNIAGANACYRNLLSTRNVLPNVQSYVTLRAKDFEKLGLPPKPKRPLTPFFKFMKNERVKVIAENPNLSSQDVLRAVSKNWSTYDTKEKEILQKSYDLEQLAYSKEVMIYQQSMTQEEKDMIKDAKTKQEDKKTKLRFKKKIQLLGKPKKPPTAFIQFIQERKYMKKKDEKVSDWVRNSAEKWRTMSLEEKAKYQVEGQKLMEQYREDMREWEEKMVRLGHIDVVRNRGLIDLKSPKPE